MFFHGNVQRVPQHHGQHMGTFWRSIAFKMLKRHQVLTFSIYTQGIQYFKNILVRKFSMLF